MEQPKKEISIHEALGALAQEIIKLDRRTVELAEADGIQTQTVTSMVNAFERVVQNYGIAFRRISEILISMGANIQGPELDELRKLFDKPSPPEGYKN